VFRNSIQGLDKVFRTDIEVPKVVLITGPPGSMKTSFCYSMMSSYLDKTNEFGLYITLEETADSHIRNMRSLNLKLTSNLEISDFTDLRELDEIVEVDSPTDYLQFIIQTIGYYKKKHGDRFTVFSLDSLGALYSLMDDVKGMRKKMFYFFKTLRDNEGFLVDGIIELGLDRTRGKLVRYMRVEKMRATEHSMERHTMEVGDHGLTILGPTLA